jgi:hypothetical protein
MSMTEFLIMMAVGMIAAAVYIVYGRGFLI